MQINLESVADGVVIDFGGEAAGSDQGSAVEPALVRNREQLGGSFPGLFAAAPAEIYAELAGARIHASLQRSHDRSGHSRRVPVHTHDAAKRLEPERIAQPGEKLASAIVRDDVFGDSRSELLHSLGEPRGTRPPWSGRSAKPERFIPTRILVTRLLWRLDRRSGRRQVPVEQVNRTEEELLLNTSLMVCVRFKARPTQNVIFSGLPRPPQAAY